MKKKNNNTDIVICLDVSGSMTSIKNDMSGSLKSFLDDQKKLDGRCNVSLITFNQSANVIFEGYDIHETNEIPLNPSGGTALYDGIALAINTTANRLKGIPEPDQPSLVTIIIITDGEENASRNFNKENIKNLIKHQESNYNWQFLFMGANIDAFNSGLGFQKGKIMHYSANTESVTQMVNCTSSMVRNLRASDSTDYSNISFGQDNK